MCRKPGKGADCDWKMGFTEKEKCDTPSLDSYVGTSIKGSSSIWNKHSGGFRKISGQFGKKLLFAQYSDVEPVNIFRSGRNPSGRLPTKIPEVSTSACCVRKSKPPDSGHFEK